MTGWCIAVVGPSGVGKDSVMAALAAARPFVLARRVITRPAAPESEAFESVSEADFAARAAAGDFVLHWEAHGLSYGVPRSVLGDLAAGRDVLVNLSRGVLAEAHERFARFLVLELSATPDTLARRLAGRGREDAAAIAARLARGAPNPPPDVTVLKIANDGPLDVTAPPALAAKDAA